MSSETGRGVLFEYLKDKVMTGSEFDLRLASAVMFIVESVKVITFDDGNPLLSGSADSNAHSSSSAGAAGGATFCCGVIVPELKLNREGDLEVCWGVACLIGVVRDAKGSEDCCGACCGGGA